MKLMRKEPKVVVNVTTEEGMMYEFFFEASYLRRNLEKGTGTEKYCHFKIPVKKNGKIINGKKQKERKNAIIVPFTLLVKDVWQLVRIAELSSSIVPKVLQDYLIDWTQILSQTVLTPIKGRDEEIERIWSCLSKNKDRNAILVGDNGVGKTTTAYEIARQIAKGECPVKLSKTRVLILNTKELLKIDSDFWFEKRLNQIQEFIFENKDNIIVYIDNLLYMKFDEKLAFMLYEMLDVQNIRLISTIDKEDFDEYFLEDQFVRRHLNEIALKEPQPTEIFDIIEDDVNVLKKEYNVGISKDIIDFAIATASLSKSISAEPGNVLNVLDRAFSEANRKGKKEVDKQCVLSCYDTDFQLYKNIAIDELRITTYHELGHYILFKKAEHLEDIKVQFVSVIPMGDFLGVNMYYGQLGKKLTYDRESYEDLIAVYLAGRIAESKITNKFSSGASGDLHVANEYATQMLMIYGLSRKKENKNRSYIYNYNFLNDAFMTEEKKKVFDDEIQEIIEKCYKKAEKIIFENWDLIEVLAKELLEKKIMTDEELDAICKKYEKGN